MQTKTLGQLVQSDLGSVLVVKQGVATYAGVLYEVRHFCGATSGRPCTSYSLLVWEGDVLKRYHNLHEEGVSRDKYGHKLGQMPDDSTTPCQVMSKVEYEGDNRG